MRDKKEIFGARHVSEKCACKTCVYPDPQTKPSDVYYDGAECEYYAKED